MPVWGTYSPDGTLLSGGTPSPPPPPPPSTTISPTGIPSVEAFGTPTITWGLLPAGIPSAEAFGTPTIASVLLPTGIPSGEAFGTPTIGYEVFPSGIASAEAFGTPEVHDDSLRPTGIPSEEAFGTPVVTYVPTEIFPTGIPSGEAFGTPVVTYSSAVPTLTYSVVMECQYNGVLTFNSANGTALVYADADDTSGDVHLTAVNGKFTLSGTTGLTFTIGDGTADYEMRFSGTIANINAALDGATYTPDTGFAGQEYISILLTDPHGVSDLFMPQIQTSFITPGSYSWTVPAVLPSTINFQGHGSGSGGQTDPMGNNGAGGGGGAYSETVNVSVTPGSTVLTIFVPTGGAASTSGADCTVDEVMTNHLTAKGGNGQTGGAASGGTGSTKHSGGDGGGVGGTGGGGGGQAGQTGTTGANGSASSGAFGGAGGGSGSSPGQGGDGGDAAGNGHAGKSPGGGGGGGGTAGNGAAGGNGRVSVFY